MTEKADAHRLSYNGEVMHTIAFEIDDGKTTAIYVVRNPDKLKHVSLGPVLH